MNEQTKETRLKKGEVGNAEETKAPVTGADSSDQKISGGQQAARGSEQQTERNPRGKTIQEKKAELHDVLVKHIYDEARRTRIAKGEGTAEDHFDEEQAQRAAAHETLNRKQPQQTQP